MSEDLRYPIGKYEAQPYNESQKTQWIIDLSQLPNSIEAAITNLDEAQLLTPYRPGGWTVQQVVHHVADSHINAFCRFKLTLSEQNPVIKPYNEAIWATQADVNLPINISITLLHALHLRMVELIKNINHTEWDRLYTHPETGGQHTLWYLLGMYAWHGRHHTAHINTLRERNSW